MMREAVVIILPPTTWGHSSQVRLVVMVTEVSSLSFRNKVEEQLACDFRERMIAQFIAHHLVKARFA
jgi:hypothetical protein